LFRVCPRPSAAFSFGNIAGITVSKNNRVCPVEGAGGLDNVVRRWLQNPRKILEPYLKEGMKAMDFGCGPGFFSIEMAHLVGESGHIIAVDLQEGMLQKLRKKIQATEFEKRITLHKCKPDEIAISECVDFVLAFYMIHEIADQEAFFTEVRSLLSPNGNILIVEPPLHVSKQAFENTIQISQAAGFIPLDRPRIFFGRSVLLQRNL
jgi:ubiquinone/menaquinone biosynthesis C-methylase UbiE